MSNSIRFDLYKYAFLSLNQATINGIKNVAKPLLLLSIFDCIDKKRVINNMLFWDVLEEAYNRLKTYYGLNIITKAQYPFYFLQSDGFYYLKWKVKPIKTKSPTAKMLRDNVYFAYLDNALWDLLQDGEVRQQYKTLIIDNFLTNK